LEKLRHAIFGSETSKDVETSSRMIQSSRGKIRIRFAAVKGGMRMGRPGLDHPQDLIVFKNIPVRV
jgi:hypothetical protein